MSNEPSSGKDTVAAYLTDNHGFVHVSTGDLVRFYVIENKLGEPTRPVLHKASNDLRAKHGPDYFAKLALQDEARRLIISGLRNPHEVRAIKDAGGHIIAVRAPQPLRYERAKQRGRIGDDLTLEEFVRQEEAENAHRDPNGQRVMEVLDLADHTIMNEGELADLHAKIEQVLAKIAPA